MKKLHISLFAAIFALTLISPLSSHAASTSAQSAIRLTDNHVLFTITYDIGFLNRGAYAPLLANSTVENAVSYSITAANGNKMFIPSAGFITAKNAELENNYWRLQYGKKSDFTLSVIAQIPKSETEYTLTINKMPFILIDKDNSTKLSEYTPQNLANYKTPGVK